MRYLDKGCPPSNRTTICLNVILPHLHVEQPVTMNTRQICRFAFSCINSLLPYVYLNVEQTGFLNSVLSTVTLNLVVLFLFFNALP